MIARIAARCVGAHFVEAVLVGAVLAGALAAGSTAQAQDIPADLPAPQVERFDRFIAAATPVCMTAASTRCVDQSWQFGDADGNGRLTLGEAETLRDGLAGWARWPGNTADKRERALIYLGLSMVDTVGLERLIGGLDADGDGGLTRAELLADVTLDERPLGTVLMDPQSVDRAALGRRFGAMAPMIGAFFGQ